MRRDILLCLAVLLWGLALSALQPDFASDPAISPDGSQVCFVFAGDLWLVPFSGGEAKRITATQSAEWGPCWSPDGAWIAFNANRENNTYPYLIPAEGGEARPVIAESYTISDWFSDSANLLCTRSNPDFGSSYYKVPVDGTRPVLLAEIGDRYASLSPDNRSIVFNRNGNPHREALTGSLAGELWQIDLATKAYTRLTKTDLTERYPRFSQVNDALYYCASDGSCFQIFRAEKLNFKRREQLTDFTQWSARDISLARTSDRMVFELFNEIWKLEPGTQPASRLEIEIRQDLWQQDRQYATMKDNFEDFAVSGDELLLAFRYKYDTFFMPRKGGEVRQITSGQASTGNLEFLEDKRTLLMQMMEQGRDKLYVVKCDSSMVARPLDWFGADSLDVENFYRDPCGKWVIYYGDKRLSSRVAVADSNLANIHPLNITRPVVSNIAFTSRGDYAVFATTREDFWTRELWLYDFARNEQRKLLNDDFWIGNMAWTKDDRSILISRGGGIHRLDLVPRDEFEFETDNWREILDTAQPEAKTNAAAADSLALSSDTLATAAPDSLAQPDQAEEQQPRELEIVWAGLEKRLYPVLTESGYNLDVQKAIDDSTFYYLTVPNSSSGVAELKKANIYGSNAKREFELGSGVYSGRWVGPVLYYVRDGVIRFYNTDKGSKGEVRTQFDYAYSEKTLNTRVFEQVWGVFGLNFYDPNMHGQDWQSLYDLYHPYAEKARSVDDIATVVNEMIGDVNASHTGFYPRREEAGTIRRNAWLGLEFDYSVPLSAGISVARVYPTSRLACFYKMQAGDIITHINGTAITSKTPLDSLLADQAGKRVKLRYTSGGVPRDAVVTGLSYSEQRRLYYTYKVARSKQTVDEITKGRIGYVHIPAMGGRDFENFQREVFRDNADKEALIIDVRGNSGGHVHDQIISLISKKPYAWSTSRRYSGELNQEPRRAWTRPTIVLVDEGSFSDGEIFPTVYQELELGKVVGVPSSGSVIGTWEYDLIDGSSMRLPGSGWYRLDGTNMEGNGVLPDIVVELEPEDEIAGRDTQLLRAIEEILKEVE